MLFDVCIRSETKVDFLFTHSFDNKSMIQKKNQEEKEEKNQESRIENQEEGIRSEISHNSGEEETKAEANEISKEEHGGERETKAIEYLNDLKRCRADFENYKKRQQEAQKELGGYLIEKLVLDIVPVLDNFRSATQHVPPEEKDSPWVVGIQYIEKQLETVLTDNGVQMIEVKESEVFDPKIHEAVSNAEPTTNDQRPTTEENVQEKGSESSVVSRQLIVKAIQKGYKFGNRVIRPAKVIVK